MYVAEQTETLLLKRREVIELLTIEECIAAVEQAFKLYAQGKTTAPKVMGLHAENGGFHIKAGLLGLERTYFVAKVNANFPGNFKQHELPVIQGIIVVCDATDGRLLALIDSIEITIMRTGAATAVAAKYLSLHHANTATICGCGNQGRISLQAMMKVRKLKKVFAFDIDSLQAERFAREFSNEIKVISIAANDLHDALNQSQICITCTPSKKPFIRFRAIEK